MSGNDGDKRTKSVTTQTASLMPSAKNALDTSLGAARNLYNAGGLFKPYTGSTVVPFSGETRNAMAGMVNSSIAAMPGLTRAFNDTADFAVGSGFNAPQNDAIARLQAVSRGDYLDPSNNPGFGSVLKQAQDAASDSVNMNAAGMGRTGSGVHQSVLGKTIGDVTGNLLYNNYATERGRQDQATGDLFNAGQQGVANKQRATALLPAAYAGMMDPYRTYMGVGSMLEDQTARQMNDDLRIWREQQDQPRKAIEWLNAIGTGAGQLGGSTTSTSQVPRPSPFMTGLGGASAGFGLTGGNPIGGLIGGGLGLLGGLF